MLNKDLDSSLQQACSIVKMQPQKKLKPKKPKNFAAMLKNKVDAEEASKLAAQEDHRELIKKSSLNIIP